MNIIADVVLNGQYYLMVEIKGTISLLPGISAGHRGRLRDGRCTNCYSEVVVAHGLEFGHHPVC